MSALDDAVVAVRSGGLVVIPTDTVYGIGGRPDDPEVTARIFAAKGRPLDLELPILVAGAGQAMSVADVDDRAQALALAFWPGPLTLVLPRAAAGTGQAMSVADVDDRAQALALAFWPGPLTLVLPRAAGSVGWMLGGNPATVGVRVPAHPLALGLLAATGPMAVTSANPSGMAPCTDEDTLVAAFGDLVAVYLCEVEPLVGAASTVLDLTGREPRILREGSVSADEIASALG